MTREHWVQTVIAICGILVPMMLTAFGICWYLAVDIESTRADAHQVNDVTMQKVIADSERIGALEKTTEQRILSLEKARDTDRADDLSFRAEIRGKIDSMASSLQASIATVISQLADLRVQQARAPTGHR